jgi:hypothetical protein
MSHSPLQRVILEAREDLGRRPAPPVDWNEVDRKLFDRIEQSENAALASGRTMRVAWTTGAALVSAAAIAALVLGRATEVRPLESVRAVSDEPAGTIVSVEGEGDLLVNGKQAPVGSTLRVDDIVEARGAARVTVERPGKVTFVLEHGTRTVVEHVQGALVLALERGSVEAQVVPVAWGEAFAVDVGHARVAVHGTHLRVERQRASAGPMRSGDLVVVDLSEGVVSVGEAPRIGSTSGVLVTAPAHAEFAADDAQGTLNVTHNLALVRAPVSLGPLAQVRTAPPPPQAAPAAHAEPGEVRGAPAAVLPVRSEPRAASGGGAGPSTLSDPNADATLAAAVRACFAERPSAANVTVSVSTTLHLTLHGDGTVRGARFDPPVAPDVNACAAQSIYRMRFAHGGTADISVDFREPSTTAP